MRLHETAYFCLDEIKFLRICVELKGALIRFVEQVKPWIKAFRRAIKVSVGTGWTVQPDRGYIRVLYGTKKTGF